MASSQAMPAILRLPGYGGEMLPVDDDSAANYFSFDPRGHGNSTQSVPRESRRVASDRPRPSFWASRVARGTRAHERGVFCVAPPGSVAPSRCSLEPGELDRLGSDLQQASRHLAAVVLEAPRCPSEVDQAECLMILGVGEE